jgi:N-methylhydantoinase A
MLRVGPRSAGSTPGPAAYGKGGENPTVTDANLVLGLIDPDYYLGGAMKVDPCLSKNAIEEKVAKKLGVDVVTAASGIYMTVSSNMSGSLRNMSIKNGYDPRDFDILSYGGGGGLFIMDMAKELNVNNVIIPKMCAVYSAFGQTVSDVRVEKTKSLRSFFPVSAKKLNGIFEELTAEAVDVLRTSGVKDKDIVIKYEADMQFGGQVHATTVYLPNKEYGDDLNEEITGLFVSQYEKLFGAESAAVSSGVEILNYRVIGLGITVKPVIEKKEVSKASVKDAFKSERKVFLPMLNDYADVEVYDGSKLYTGMSVSGPAIVEMVDTTILLIPGNELTVDVYDNFIVRV